MRIVVGFLIAACVVGFFLSQRHSDKTTETTPASVATSAPAPVPPAREHHWPKSAFDRVDDMKRQVAAERKQDQTK
jgi:hypothetical protein